MRAFFPKVWPFKKHKRDPIQEKIDAENSMLWLSWPREAQIVISKSDMMTNFHMSGDKIIESVPAEICVNPIFQDGFFYLSQKLKEIEHTSVLKLLDFGWEGSRLYRMWERREIFSACVEGPRAEAQTRSLLLPLVEGLELIQDAGSDLTKINCHRISIDRRGYFVARFPYTVKSSLGPISFATNIGVHGCHPDIDSSDKDKWLFHMGVFLCCKLTAKLPFEEPPLLSIGTGNDIKKISLDLEPRLLEVVNRFLEINPQKTYPTINQALKELRLALQ